MLSGVKTLHGNYPTAGIWVIGHSLGGAISTFAALNIANEFPDLKKDMEYFSLEQPRVGNKEFVTYFESVLPQAFRITHWKDPVPHLPLREMKFFHFGKEVFYKEDFNNYTVCSEGESFRCAD